MPVPGGVHDLRRHCIGLRHQVSQTHWLDAQFVPHRRGMVHGRVVADQAHSKLGQHLGQCMRRGAQSQNPDHAAVQFAPQVNGSVPLPGQGVKHASPVQHQQGTQKVFGVGADIGGQGLYDLDTALAAGFEVGVVGAGVHAGHHLELGREVQELLGDHQLARQHHAANLVHGASQRAAVFGQLRSGRYLVTAFEPGHGLWHHRVKK
jgi:hypothetical protein